MHVRIASDSETHQPITIGDMERRGGFYILGKPRMGKSWLMINLMMQDIQNGHGVFFLDPHGDAIADLIAYCSSLSMYDRCLLLDPENEDYSFGINLLECRNPAGMKARNDTFTKAKGFFDKLWRNTFEEKPWLQMILQNRNSDMEDSAATFWRCRRNSSRAFAHR